jgi:hypothetical protein
VRGPETTGEEGYYMRSPDGKAVGYSYSEEIIDLYEKYKERHGGTESGISITKTRLTENIKSEKGESALINDLAYIGADAIRRGHTSFKAFSAQMKTTLSEVWDKIKHLMREAYEAAKVVLRSERGMIGGTKAIGAPTGQLAKAQEMLAEGKDKKEVWRKTGWMKGAEKEDTWKFEIDDSGAELSKPYIKKDDKYSAAKHLDKWMKTLRDPNVFATDTRLVDILDHAELYKAYPQLKNITVRLVKGGNEGASYNDKINQILFNAPDKLPTNSQILKILLHEAQHAIQEIEGFAKGGSPKAMKTMENVAILAKGALAIKNQFLNKKQCLYLSLKVHHSLMTCFFPHRGTILPLFVK